MLIYEQDMDLQFGKQSKQMGPDFLGSSGTTLAMVVYFWSASKSESC